MGVLWGFIMYFICHTACTIFACNLYNYMQEGKCKDKNQYAMKKYLITFLIALVVYVFVLIIALLVSPFADHKAGILIGNGIGFITGSIHFRLMAEANYYKQKTKNDWVSWVSDVENIAKFRNSQASKDTDDAFDSTIKTVVGMTDDADDIENEDKDEFDDDTFHDDNIVDNEENDYDKSSMMGLFGVVRVHDEKSFAQHQRMIGGSGFFPDPSFNKEKFRYLQQRKLNTDDLSTLEESKLIFPYIFGNFDCEIDLNFALLETKDLLNRVMKKKPKTNFTRDNKTYMRWLSEFAVPQILLGTIYAYQHEYVKAAYHLMIGLKTEQIPINMPYCDFIRYVLSKLPEYVSNEAKYSGCGFSSDNPMGSCGGNMLVAQNAMKIIPEMEGLNGEVIIARMGSTGLFGHLSRKGSTIGNNSERLVDIYETYIIDSNYNASRIRFYFNGYFNIFNINVKVASGFKIKSHSALLNQMNFITE